jgi:ABC-type multidrug transport system fused ATPase/permease subunit
MKKILKNILFFLALWAVSILISIVVAVSLIIINRIFSNYTFSILLITQFSIIIAVAYYRYKKQKIIFNPINSFKKDFSNVKKVINSSPATAADMINLLMVILVIPMIILIFWLSLTFSQIMLMVLSYIFILIALKRILATHIYHQYKKIKKQFDSLQKTDARFSKAKLFDVYTPFEKASFVLIDSGGYIALSEKCKDMQIIDSKDIASYQITSQEYSNQSEKPEEKLSINKLFIRPIDPNKKEIIAVNNINLIFTLTNNDLITHNILSTLIVKDVYYTKSFYHFNKIYTYIMLPYASIKEIYNNFKDYKIDYDVVLEKMMTEIQDLLNDLKINHKI